MTTLTARPRFARNPAPSQLSVGLVMIALVMVAVLGNVLMSLAAALAFWVIWRGAFTTPIHTVTAVLLTYQWVQASMKIWMANFLRIDLSVPQTAMVGQSGRWFEVTSTTQAAILASLAAVAFISLGARLLLPRIRISLDVSAFVPSRLFLGYAIIFVGDLLLRPHLPLALVQPANVLVDLRFVFGALLVLTYVTGRRGFLPLAAVVGIEVVTSVGGFFADFVNIGLVVGAALATLAVSHWRRVGPLVIIGFVGILALGIVWTIIKPAYRLILNQGTTNQSVQIDAQQRYGALGGLISQISFQDLGDGVLSLASRLSYVDYIADVIERVPTFVPYQDGALTWTAIELVLTPRILFPNKGVLQSDSERTMIYTGRQMASGDRGTSISIGYVGEAYVDFGYAGIFLIPISLGLLLALMARHIIHLMKGRDPAVAVAAIIVAFLPVHIFEMSITKLLPGLMWTWIVVALAIAVVWPYVRGFFAITPKRMIERGPRRMAPG